ncbi:protein-glutamate O-methyltransferase CheR [Rurimicrobium arvi]|uniref:Protein-glutamate O-methyltransferase CheR n=1 Tax=Rurimicrobium arvi TaxID=2049916 RepID=A0ABP8MCT4_9BACT
MIELKVNDAQVKELLDDIMRLYGYDFSEYSKASIIRRINRLISLDRFEDFAAFRNHLRRHPDYLKRFIEEVTVNVTEMFRDPLFYNYLRTTVFPEIAMRPFIRIWHAGCATGEEVYSMAILLKESGLLHKSLIYATDINPDVVEKTRSGIFPLIRMREYSENYRMAGGTQDFSSYYTAQYDRVIFRDELKEKMICATHNLVSDGSFNEFQLILCRNVLIYFDRGLQERVLDLFDASLERLGFLALGTKETLKFSGLQQRYKQQQKERIWRKEY